MSQRVQNIDTGIISNFYSTASLKKVQAAQPIQQMNHGALLDAFWKDSTATKVPNNSLITPSNLLNPAANQNTGLTVQLQNIAATIFGKLNGSKNSQAPEFTSYEDPDSSNFNDILAKIDNSFNKVSSEMESIKGSIEKHTLNTKRSTFVA